MFKTEIRPKSLSPSNWKAGVRRGLDPVTSWLYPPVMKVALGERISSYVLESHLGRGGVGDVWRAVNEETGEAVAVKVLHSAASELPERIVREAAFQRAIDSLHVVRVLDFLKYGDHSVVVMELIEGPTLRHWLRSHNGLVPIDQIDAIAEGLFEGVAAAHTAGLVHRDLKPSNILLAQEGVRVVPKVSDFGLARTLESTDFELELTRPGVGMGTPGYMAPEQIRDASSVDQRADVFSLGAILYLLCTGQRAFVGANRFDVLRRTTEGRYTPPLLLRGDLPPRMAYAIRLALQSNPQDRIEDIAHLRTAWKTPDPPVVELNVAETLTGWEVERSAHLLEPVATLGVLPRLTGDTVGRDADRIRVIALLNEGPVVTLIGPGGVGKTRLAIEIAYALPLKEVWFCELSEVTDLMGVCEVVAGQLGIKLQAQDPVSQVGHAIGARAESLVILDNAEQAVDGVAQALSLWRILAPRARFLITSRQPLQLSVEQPFTVGPLREHDAVRLFIARARHLEPTFSVPEQSLHTLTQIVEQLDCLPLAIELAAARTNMLDLGQILKRLDQRFHLLRSRETFRSDRQATLRGTIHWSWDMLKPWTKLALAQCTVFRGGFTIEAAETVVDISAWPEAPWAMDAIHELLDHSLLRVRPGPDGNNRLVQYVSIRAFCEEEMAQEGAIEGPEGQSLTGVSALAQTHQRHGEFYSRWGDDACLQALQGRGGHYHLRNLRIEMDNLSAAIRRSAGTAWEQAGAQCALASSVIGHNQGPYAETSALLQQVLLDFKNVNPSTRAGLVQALGTLHVMQGQSSEGLALFEQALSEFRTQKKRLWEASVLRKIGALHSRLGRLVEAQEVCDEALRIQRQEGDRINEGLSLHTLGTLCWYRGDMCQAKQFYQMALVAHREMGNREGEGTVVGNLGLVHQRLGDMTTARKFLEAALVIHRETGNHRSETGTLSGLGTLCLEEGELDQAGAYITQALAMSRKTGDRPVEGNVLLNCGVWYQSQGRMSDSVAQYEQALTIFREVGDSIGEGALLNNLANLHLGEGRMTVAKDLLCQSRDLNREMKQRMYEGRAIGNLGELWLEQGAFDTAEECFLRALDIHRDVRDRRFEGIVLGNLGNLYGVVNQSEKAIQHFGQATEIHRELNNRLFEVLVLIDRGRFYGERSQWDSARACLEQAFSIFEEYDDQQNEGHAFAAIGGIALELGDEHGAAEAFQKALVLLDAVDSRGATLCRAELALLSAQEEELRVARKQLTLCLERYQAPYFFRRLTLLCVLSEVAYTLGQHEEAQAALSEIHAALEGHCPSTLASVRRRIDRMEKSFTADHDDARNAP